MSGGHQDVVPLLLERKPNINSLDKDGSTALSIACKEGFQEIASALISSGAYLNTQVIKENFVFVIRLTDSHQHS